MFGENRMLFQRAVARRPRKADSWHKAHFEAHGEEINLPPRFEGLKNFRAYLCTSVFAPCICQNTDSAGQKNCRNHHQS